MLQGFLCPSLVRVAVHNLADHPVPAALVLVSPVHLVPVSLALLGLAAVPARQAAWEAVPPEAENIIKGNAKVVATLRVEAAHPVARLGRLKK